MVTVICHVRDLESSSAVSLIGLELYPQPFGAGGEGNGPFVCLTCLISRHRVGQSCVCVCAQRQISLSYLK